MQRKQRVNDHTYLEVGVEEACILQVCDAVTPISSRASEDNGTQSLVSVDRHDTVREYGPIQRLHGGAPMAV